MKQKPQQSKPSPHPQLDAFVKRVLAYRPQDDGQSKTRQPERRQSNKPGA